MMMIMKDTVIETLKEAAANGYSQKHYDTINAACEPFDLHNPMYRLVRTLNNHLMYDTESRGDAMHKRNVKMKCKSYSVLLENYADDHSLRVTAVEDAAKVAHLVRPFLDLYEDKELINEKLAEKYDLKYGVKKAMLDCIVDHDMMVAMYGFLYIPFARLNNTRGRHDHRSQK